MADKKLPPEGARWEIDDWKPSDSDSQGKLDTYIKRLEKAEKLNETQAREIELLNSELEKYDAQKADFDLIRSGRDARVLSLEANLKSAQDTLDSNTTEREQLKKEIAYVNKECDKVEATLAQKERALASHQTRTKKDLRNHKLIIGGVAFLTALIFWGWVSAMNSKRELQESNSALASSKKALESDQRSTADLRSEISSLKSRNQGLANQVNSLQSSLSKEQRRAQSAIQRETQNAQRGEMPGTVQSYPQVRSMFLAYINAMPAKFGVDSKYVSCVRGGVLDELERSYGRSGRRWRTFKSQTKYKIESCKRDLNYKTRAELNGAILNDYMYKENNFLDQVQRKF